jgi:hypothetical protein
MLVSMLPKSMLRETTFPHKCVLMEISSFAIWEWNKVIMAITVVILVGNISFQLSGEFTFSIPCESQRMTDVI